MKFIKIILAMLVMALSFSSCLESDLKDLPTFDGNDITADMLGIVTLEKTRLMPADSLRLSRSNCRKQQRLLITRLLPAT